MPGANHEKILATRPPGDFVGREDELARLTEHARTGSGSDGMLIFATPGTGATELLKQTYDRLFYTQRDVIPFYFPIRRGVTRGRELAEDFLNEFIRQLVAFRRRDPSVVRSATGLDELAELSLSVSGIWIDRLITTARQSSDGRSFLRTCFSAPIRAAAHGDHAFMMIDDVHRLLNFDDGATVSAEFKDVFEDSDVKFAISGNRRYVRGQVEADRLNLYDLPFEKAGHLVEVFAKENELKITEPSRDLIAEQLGGNAALMRHLIREASDCGIATANFEDVEKAYANAIFDGRIARRFGDMFWTACRTVDLERRVIRLLSDLQENGNARLERELWHRRLQLEPAEAESMLEKLNVNELVRLTPTHVEAHTENIALTDYIAARGRLLGGAGRATVFGVSLTRYIKRASELLAEHYRSDASMGIREILGAFDGREVATLLLDYAEFRDQFKGVPDSDVLSAARAGATVTLPRIFFTAAAASFYKPLGEIAESERCAIALGFEARDDDANTDIVWIAAEIDSKLEASREVAEFWCDRLEAAAVMCDFRRYQIWLIAPDGFSPGALSVLKLRKAYGSSRRQADLLRKHLDVATAPAGELTSNEYEIVIPMDADSELIAAHAVEEIAKRHHLDPRSINQIKTALIEACINASEHSLSPDRKIYQRFRIEDDRVVLTVSNRGLRLASQPASDEPDEGRRGWGLKLMRRLMDEVRIENVDDGTRIVMTKYLSAA